MSNNTHVPYYKSFNGKEHVMDFQKSVPNAGYFRTDARYTSFDLSKSHVYQSNGDFVNEWIEKNKTLHYLYVPSNSLNITKGDFIPSSTKGIRKGFNWIELESKNMRETSASLGRDAVNNYYQIHRLDKLALWNKWFRSPIYFRSYWMNSKAYKYGMDCPRAGVSYTGYMWDKCPSSRKETADLWNKQKSDKVSREIQWSKLERDGDVFWIDYNPNKLTYYNNNNKYNKYPDELRLHTYTVDDTISNDAEDTSWAHAYPPILNGTKDWPDDVKDCYDNRDPNQFWKLGAVPHLRKITNITSAIVANAKYSNKFIKGIDLGTNDYDITAQIYDTNKGNQSTSVSCTVNGVNVSNITEFKSILRDKCSAMNAGVCDNIRSVLSITDSDITKYANIVNASDASKLVVPSVFKSPTVKQISYTNTTFINNTSIKSKAQFNNDSNVTVQNELIYLAVPTKSGCFPNYYEMTGNVSMLKKLIKSLIESKTTYITPSDANFPVHFDNSNNAICNFIPLDVTTFTNLKYGVLNWYNELVEDVLTGVDIKSKIKNMLMPSKINDELWRSGFIFNLVISLLGNKSHLGDCVPYVEKNYSFYINENQTKVPNTIKGEMKNTGFGKFYRVHAKDGYRNFGIDGEQVRTLKSNYIQYRFLDSTVNAVNVSPTKFKEEIIASTSTYSGLKTFDSGVSLKTTETLSFDLSMDNNMVSKTTQYYMNGFVHDINSNPCCCHTEVKNKSWNDQPCSHGKVTWQQGCMVQIPFTYYSINIKTLIEQLFGDYIMKFAIDNAIYKLEPELKTLKIGGYTVYDDKMDMSASNLKHNVSTCNGKDYETFDFVLDQGATATSNKIYLVQQRDMEVPSTCFSMMISNYNDGKPSNGDSGNRMKYQDTGGVSGINTNEYLMPFKAMKTIFLPKDIATDTRKTFQDIINYFGISAVKSVDNNNIVKVEATVFFRIRGVAGDFASFSKNTVNGLTPYVTNKNCYIMTNSFMEYCWNVINANIDYIVKDITHSVKQNQACKALHWFFNHKHEIAQSRYKNFPFGPMLMYNNGSYVLNYKYFGSNYDFGYEISNRKEAYSISDFMKVNKIPPKTTNQICPFTTRVIPNRLLKELENGEQIQNNDLLSNYFDTFISDVVMTMSQSRSITDNEYYVIRFPKLGNLLNITRMSYNALMSGSVVEYYTNLDAGTGCLLSSIKQDDPVILISPIALETSKISDMYKSHSIFSGNVFNINVPTVVVHNGNTDNENVKTLRIGCNKWYCYISPTLTSKTRNGSSDLYISYPMNTSELADVYSFMKWNQK